MWQNDAYLKYFEADPLTLFLLNKDLFLLLLVSVKLAISPSAVDVDEMRSVIDLQSEVSFLIRMNELSGLPTYCSTSVADPDRFIKVMLLVRTFSVCKPRAYRKYRVAVLFCEIVSNG